MIKLDATQEKELKSQGVFIQSSKECNTFEKTLSCQIEVFLPDEVELDAPECSIKVVSKRGVETYFCDFEINNRDNKKFLNFVVFQELPNGVELVQPKCPLATSYIDICWYAGYEAIANENLIPDAATPIRENTIATDLGWHLPTRFVDQALVYSLGVLNTSMFSGILEDAIIYGFVVNQKDSK